MAARSFESLQSEYNSLLARMEMTRVSAVKSTATRLMNFVKQGKYAEVSDLLGIPQIFIATSFERESSSDFTRSPAQGDRWDRVSVNVPRGRGPFASWKDAAIDAYKLDKLDRVGKGNWTWARFCYMGELFNGFGYRNKGVHTPYLWSGTNIYDNGNPVGKYTGDGKFTFGVKDAQLGTVAMACAMVQMDSSLDLPGFPGTASGVDAAAAPAAAADDEAGDSSDHGPLWLQQSLNKLGFGPVDEDGLLGRQTRAAVTAFQQQNGLTADGIAGPRTSAAIDAALKKA